MQSVRKCAIVKHPPAAQTGRPGRPQRAGLLLRVSDQVVLGPDAAVRAARILARLPQPFAAAQARQALGTTRRVAIPLLEYLDAADTTERLPDDRRRLRASPANVVDPGIDHLAT